VHFLPSRRWLGLLLAAVAVATAIPIEALLRTALGIEVPALAFFFAVLVGGWIGGLYAGLLATALSTLALLFVVDRPAWAVANAVSDTGRLLWFVIGCGLLSVILENAFRRHRRALQQAAFLDEAHDALIGWRFSGVITYWNRAAERLFGFTARDAIGRSVHELLASHFSMPLEKVHETLRREGRYEGEASCTTRDGRILTIDSRMSLMKDLDRRPIVIEAVRDITERKRAEARLECVLAIIGDHLASYDREWRYTYINDDGAAMLGKTKEDLIGKRIWDVFPEAVGNQYYRELQRAAAERRVIRSQHYYEPFDRWFENYIYPSQDGVIVFSTDISERKRREQEHGEAERRKDEFLAMLAHELRGPLAPLRSGLHIIQRTAQYEPTLQSTVEMMDRQMRQLVRLVDDLLDINRITSGKLELRREPLMLTAVVQSAIEACRSQIEEKEHTLELDIRSHDLRVDGDFARLSQVFSNLLSNAAKYTDHGGRIRVTVDADADRAIVSVQDNGIGIPPDALERVFEMFTQLPAHKQYTGGGLGIGLSLVRELVRMHGGTVHASSRGVGEGSVFTLRLPRMPVVVPPQSQQASALPAPEAKHRILIADDNIDAARSLALLLGLDGHDVRTAVDGREAIDVAREFKPRVILMDIGMPNLDGLEATRRIRAEPWGKDIKIVALTGWGQDVDRQRSSEAGADGHLIKPVDNATLMDLLARI
jgi:PAS domain S-box-containing protein